MPHECSDQVPMPLMSRLPFQAVKSPPMYTVELISTKNMCLHCWCKKIQVPPFWACETEIDCRIRITKSCHIDFAQLILSYTLLWRFEWLFACLMSWIAELWKLKPWRQWIQIYKLTQNMINIPNRQSNHTKPTNIDFWINTFKWKRPQRYLELWHYFLMQFKLTTVKLLMTPKQLVISLSKEIKSDQEPTLYTKMLTNKCFMRIHYKFAILRGCWQLN